MLFAYYEKTKSAQKILYLSIVYGCLSERKTKLFKGVLVPTKILARVQLSDY